MQQSSESEIVEIPNSAISAIAVHDQTHQMGSGSKADISFRQRPPRLPAAAVGIGHRSCFVHTIEFNVENTTIPTGGHTRLETIESIGRDVNSIVQPFT